MVSILQSDSAHDQSATQVAASGGYMMACVADRLVASPFAVLGSIGVITEQPNVCGAPRGSNRISVCPRSGSAHALTEEPRKSAPLAPHFDGRSHTPRVADERLKREGVTFSTVTAGKFKRTLTPTKKVDPQDERKLKEDIEQILALFKARRCRHYSSSVKELLLKC